MTERDRCREVQDRTETVDDNGCTPPASPIKAPGRASAVGAGILALILLFGGLALLAKLGRSVAALRDPLPVDAHVADTSPGGKR